MVRELVPLKEAARAGSQDARMLRRLETAWAWLVGPTLSRFTRPLRVRRGTLFIGCWATDHLSHLRAATDSVWPQIQARLRQALALDLQQVRIEPCDPPEKPAVKPRVQDPLRAVLDRLRQMRKERWTKPER